MKKLYNIIFVILAGLFFVTSCAYDDSLLREEIGKVEEELAGYESQVTALESQMSALTALVNSSFISYLGTDEAGNYVISYMNGNSQVKTLTLALGSDVVTSPIIGAGEFEGKLYWRQTPDNGETWSWITDAAGEKMPVGGTEPAVAIDADGYWTVNGVQAVGADGAPVLANDITNTIFSSVEYDEESGFVKFTLADGQTVFHVKMFEALNIQFDSPSVVAVPDAGVPVNIGYTVGGSQAEEAVVDWFTAYNVTVSINTYTNTITAQLDADAEEGNVVIMVSAGENVVMKPLFFTAGTAEIQKPVWDAQYGEGTEIWLEGEFTEFQISVSHNIDYEMSISEDCAHWLKVAPESKAQMVTTVHNFIADYYESDTGADRTGTISFHNKPYDVTVEVVVRQHPVVPDGPQLPGISTGADLVSFVRAVNSGSSTSRWQNDAGEVVLLNDIDVSALTEWTPIGTGKASGAPAYSLTNPFTGTFNGQGFTIKGINWTYDINSAGDSHLFGFFGALSGATVKNLILGAEGDQILITGSSSNVISVGALAGYAEASTIVGVTNNVSVILADKDAAVPGDNPNGTLMAIGGIAGSAKAPMTIGSKEAQVLNFGNVKTGAISNTGNGGTGMTVGGIVAFTVGVKDCELVLDYCYNYGGVSAPTGRGGGLVGTVGGSTDQLAVTKISNCENHGLIQDDEVGQYGGATNQYNLKRMGGLVGGTVTNTVGIRIEYCTNAGNVFSQLGCRAGGFVGHNQATIVGCVNRGIILADTTVSDGEPQHGPGWACGFNGAKNLITSCAKGGKVGGWTEYKNNPSAAPDATNDNAVCYKNADRFDPTVNF